ncbi:hypothetical protein ABPG74_015724 [Tetrahymena malaccensis]
MTSRPQIHVHDAKEANKQTATKLTLPAVFTAPIRTDIVHKVFTDLNKNRKQASGVKISTRGTAGMGHSAESWGTGRAVARIPRVGGSGTHRSGQAAFGNQCRKGRMFAPLKTYRRVHRRVNVNQKRHAVAAALAASALVPLVFARGHRISNVQELPYVFDDSVESYEKTKQAVAFLKRVGAYDDVLRVAETKAIRAGQGKLRNRRYKLRRGPLVVYGNEKATLTRALRNIPGVDVCNVNRLNLLQLAPGGHVGRFIIWTESAFKKLNEIFGTYSTTGVSKKGYQLQRPILANADIARIINSNEVQSVVKAAGSTETHERKKNPLTNDNALFKLNPAAKIAKEQAKKAAEASKAKRQATLKANRKAAKSHKKGSQAWIAAFNKANEEAIARARQEDADFIAQGQEIKEGDE